jgi:serine/threonine-protein kinase
VRPFSSALPFKDEAAIDPAGLGRKLGVQAVLTGTVRKRGDELFIACELIDVQTNSVLPSGGPYRRKLKDLFAIQEELAYAIADQLRLQLSGEDRQELGKRPTDNLDAYRSYVLGRREAEERTDAGLWKSIDLYKQAIKQDPKYALAYSGIADSYIQLGLDSLSPIKAFKAAKDHAMAAIACDPALAEAHVSLGTCYLLFEWNWPRAKKELDLALEHNPHYADAYHFYSHYYQTIGQMDEASAMMKRAVDLDPASAVHKAELA